MDTTTALGLIIAAILIGIVVYQKKRQQWKLVGQVGALVIYPIKSCHGIEVSTAESTPLGMKSGNNQDRTFMILTKERKFLSPVEKPSMALITPTFRQNQMWVDAPGMETLKISIPEIENQNANTVCISYKGMKMQGYDCGSHCNHWFQQYLDISDLTLVYFGSEVEPTLCHKKELVGPLMRKTDKGKYYEKLTCVPGNVKALMAFAHTTSYMLMAESSIEDLNERLEKRVPYTNFRPNIVVKGSIPYEEENWSLVKVGSGTILKTLKLCQRCTQVNVNAETGEKHPQEPLKTLRSYQLYKDVNLNRITKLVAPILGINMGLNMPGIIRVNDPVYVIFK